MWNREIAERYWSEKHRRESEMRWHVIDPKGMRYYEKKGGSRVWHLTKKQAIELSDAAIVVALDERNLNESLNVYWNRELFKQLHYDERNGWIS